MACLVLNAPSKNIFNAKRSPNNSLFNSFRKASNQLPKLHKSTKIPTRSLADSRPQLTLRPSLPLPKKVVHTDSFIFKERSINHMRNRQPCRPPLRKMRQPVRPRRKVTSVLPRSTTTRFTAPARVPLAPRSHNVNVRLAKPPALSKPPTIVVAQASKPKATTFLQAGIPPMQPITARKRKAICSISAPETITITEHLVFFLDGPQRRDLSQDEICANAPDSDDEFDFDEFDFCSSVNFPNDEEDEVIVSQPGGYPLRKKCRFLGVSWNTQHGKWIAQVGYRGKRHYVGQFHDCRVAAHAIDQFCIELGIAPRNEALLALTRGSDPKKMVIPSIPCITVERALIQTDPKKMVIPSIPCITVERARSTCGKRARKVPNPNWQTRGERSIRSIKRGRRSPRNFCAW